LYWPLFLRPWRAFAFMISLRILSEEILLEPSFWFLKFLTCFEVILAGFELFLILKLHFTFIDRFFDRFIKFRFKYSRCVDAFFLFFKTLFRIFGVEIERHLRNLLAVLLDVFLLTKTLILRGYFNLFFRPLFHGFRRLCFVRSD
jgi:hypothetical protein